MLCYCPTSEMFLCDSVIWGLHMAFPNGIQKIWLNQKIIVLLIYSIIIERPNLYPSFVRNPELCLWVSKNIYKLFWNVSVNLFSRLKKKKKCSISFSVNFYGFRIVKQKTIHLSWKCLRTTEISLPLHKQLPKYREY